MSEPRLRSIIGILLLISGAASLLVAAALAVITTQGWPKLTLTALAILVVAGVLIVRDIHTPS